MSYDNITPSYYEMLQPGSPWHAGSRGWTQAPYPAWGNNPNLVGPAFLATDGMGAAGIGAYYAERENLPIHGLGRPPYAQLEGCVPCAAAGIGADADARIRWVALGTGVAVIAGLVWLGRAAAREMRLS